MRFDFINVIIPSLSKKLGLVDLSSLLLPPPHSRSLFYPSVLQLPTGVSLSLSLRRPSSVGGMIDKHALVLNPHSSMQQKSYPPPVK